MTANMGNSWDNDHNVASDLIPAFPIPIGSWLLHLKKMEATGPTSQGFWQPQTWLMCAFNLLKVDNLVISG